MTALVALAACRSAPEAKAPTASTGGPDLSLVALWGDSMQASGRVPVAPATEDVSVGDVFAFSEEPGPDSISSLIVESTPRWTSLEPLDLQQLDGDIRRRPDDLFEGNGDAASQHARRPRLVALSLMERLTFQADELSPLVPIEIAALVPSLESAGQLDVEVEVQEGWTESVAVTAAVREILEPTPSGFGVRLDPSRFGGLSLVANPASPTAFLSVVTETLSTTSLTMLIRTKRGSDGRVVASKSFLESGELDAIVPTDPAVEAIQRAQALNEALTASGIEDRVDGRIQFVSVTDRAVVLRRTWSHPLVVAVRGLTLDVDLETGTVLRSGPLGRPLPDLGENEDDDSSIEDESEVLEERRRGAVDDVADERIDVTYPHLYWEYGPRLDALGGDLKLYAGGRIHADAAEFWTDDDIEEEFEDPDSGANMRRAFLELGGAYEQLDFNLWLNFANVELIGEEEIDFDTV
ncbi:MAG: hypothetical protein AAGA20_08805, partial [Planctomycetota bacterium]